MDPTILILVSAAAICLLIWWGVARFSKPAPAPRKVETPYGVFTEFYHDKNAFRWEADFPELGEDVTVFVPDKDGNPDPEFLSRIPGLARLVQETDSVARTALGEEYEDLDPFPIFHLSSVELNEGESFELHYATDTEQGHDFSVFLTIDDGKVTDILLVD